MKPESVELREHRAKTEKQVAKLLRMMCAVKAPMMEDWFCSECEEWVCGDLNLKCPECSMPVGRKDYNLIQIWEAARYAQSMVDRLENFDAWLKKKRAHEKARSKNSYARKSKKTAVLRRVAAEKKRLRKTGKGIPSDKKK